MKVKEESEKVGLKLNIQKTKIKNLILWTVVLGKTLESPLDCKEIQPVHPKGNQSWIFIERTDAEAENEDTTEQLNGTQSEGHHSRLTTSAYLGTEPGNLLLIYFVVVQSLSHVWFFATLWTAGCQAFLSFTISWSLLELMSIESVMPFNLLILCHPFSSYLQSFLASGSFPMSQLFLSSGQSIGALASGSVLLLNIQDWFPVWKYQFFSAQLFLWSNSHIHTWLLEKPQLWLYRLYTKVEKYSFNLWYLCTTFRVIRVVMYAHNYGQPVKVTLCLLHWDEIYTYIWMGYK